jgi:type I restriction enzyme, R subunit
VDANELTGEADPVVKLIDLAHPERNMFHAINQFRVDTPGCVKNFIIPDIVLFVNGIPLVVVEAKIGDANTANPIHEAFVQLLRYRNERAETKAAGLREGEPRLFHSNLLIIRTCGEKAEFGTITSGHEHFYAWQDIWPEKNRTYKPPLGTGPRRTSRVKQPMRPRQFAVSWMSPLLFCDAPAPLAFVFALDREAYAQAAPSHDLERGLQPNTHWTAGRCAPQ